MPEDHIRGLSAETMGRTKEAWIEFKFLNTLGRITRNKTVALTSWGGKHHGEMAQSFKYEKNYQRCGLVGVVICLLCVTTWVTPQHHIDGVHACDPSACTQEVEAGGSAAQGHPQLYDEFKSSLGYMRLSLGKQKDKQQPAQNKTLSSAKGGQMEGENRTGLAWESSDLNQLCVNSQ